MLKRIKCRKFLQKEIIFHKGLNSIIGDNIGSNSIGKTILLMIIDFVFGGKSYITENNDVVEQLGHHTIFFSYIFHGQEYFFSRSTDSYNEIIICNEKFEPIDKRNIDEFCLWLQRKYSCELSNLSFRSIVGRYFRIYGKENLNERKPIQYFEKEKSVDSILYLIKLFDKYNALKTYENTLKSVREEKKILTGAGKKQIISAPTNKTAFRENEKKISKLEENIELIKKDIINQSTDIKSVISKEVLELQREKSNLSVLRNTLSNRLQRTQINIKNKKSKVHLELDKFNKYFSDFKAEEVKNINNFHENIANILKKELSDTEKKLKKEIEDVNLQIEKINNEIDNTLKIEDAPRASVDQLLNLTTEINSLKEQNEFFNKKNNLTSEIKELNSDYKELKVQVTDDISNQINTYMSMLNKIIYKDSRRAPNFNIHDKSYTFNTYGDTGTGTAFASLISFDLSLLNLTCLPALIHDLPLLKNIENKALENIITLYAKSQKQIFIAIDKLNSYNSETQKTIYESKVIKLSHEKILFIKNWKNKN